MPGTMSVDVRLSSSPQRSEHAPTVDEHWSCVLALPVLTYPRTLVLQPFRPTPEAPEIPGCFRVTTDGPIAASNQHTEEDEIIATRNGEEGSNPWSQNVSMIAFPAFTAVCGQLGRVAFPNAMDPLLVPGNISFWSPTTSSASTTTDVDRRSSDNNNQHSNVKPQATSLSDLLLQTSSIHRFEAAPVGSSLYDILRSPLLHGRNAVILLHHPPSSSSTDGTTDDASSSWLGVHEMMIGSPDAFGFLPLALKTLYDEPTLESLLTSSHGTPVASGVHHQAPQSSTTAGVELVIETSFVAFSQHTAVDLVDYQQAVTAASNPNDHVAPSSTLRVNLLEDENHFSDGRHSGGGRCEFRITGERRLLARNLDDALETLDMGLEGLTYATERGILRGSQHRRDHATLVFTVMLHTRAHSATLTFVSIGRDEVLRQWFRESIIDASAALRHREDTRSSESSSGGTKSPPQSALLEASDATSCASSYMPTPLHHHAATLLLPLLLCGGNYRVGLYVGLPSSNGGDELDASEAAYELLTAATCASKLCTRPYRGAALNESTFEGLAVTWLDDQASTHATNNSLQHPVVGADPRPLPPGWEAVLAETGQVYYVDHNTKMTTWTHPLSAAAQSNSHRGGVETPVGNAAVAGRLLVSAEDYHSSSSAVVYTVDHDRQCWGGGTGVGDTSSHHHRIATAEVSVMIMDPEMKPRVVVVGSRDVSAVVEDEILSASGTAIVEDEFVDASVIEATNHSTDLSITQQQQHVRATSAAQAMVSIDPASPTLSSSNPFHSSLPPDTELVRYGDMSITVPASVADELSVTGESVMADHVRQSVAQNNFLEDLAQRVEQSIDPSTSGSFGCDPRALSEVRQYLVRPSSDEAKIESFLHELEGIMNQSLDTAAQNRALKSEIRSLRSELTMSQQHEQMNQVSSPQASASLFETLLLRVSRAAAPCLLEIGGSATAGDDDELSSEDRIVAVVEQLVHENQRLTVLTSQQATDSPMSQAPDTARAVMVSNTATASCNSKPTSEIMEALEVTLHARHVEIVAQLCEKQKEVIRRMYSEFEDALETERRKSSDLAHELQKEREERQQLRRQQHRDESPAPPQPTSMAPSSPPLSPAPDANMGDIQEPSLSRRRWSEVDDQSDGDGDSTTEEDPHNVGGSQQEGEGLFRRQALGGQQQQQQLQREPSYHSNSSFHETDSEYALLISDARSSQALQLEQDQMVARLQRYRNLRTHLAQGVGRNADNTNQYRQQSHRDASSSPAAATAASNRAPSTPPLTSSFGQGRGASNRSNGAYQHFTDATLDRRTNPTSTAAVGGGYAARSGTATNGAHRQAGRGPFTTPPSALDLLKQRHMMAQETLHMDDMLASLDSRSSRSRSNRMTNDEQHHADRGFDSGKSSSLAVAADHTRRVTHYGTSGRATTTAVHSAGASTVPGSYNYATTSSASPPHQQSTTPSPSPHRLAVPKPRSTSSSASRALWNPRPY